MKSALKPYNVHFTLVGNDTPGLPVNSYGGYVMNAIIGEGAVQAVKDVVPDCRDYRSFLVSQGFNVLTKVGTINAPGQTFLKRASGLAARLRQQREGEIWSTRILSVAGGLDEVVLAMQPILVSPMHAFNDNEDKVEQLLTQLVRDQYGIEPINSLAQQAKHGKRVRNAPVEQVLAPLPLLVPFHPDVVRIN